MSTSIVVLCCGSISFSLRRNVDFSTVLFYCGPIYFLLRRYADLSIVALSSRLDGVEQHHADK